MLTLLHTRRELTASLRGAILAPQEYTIGTVWRAHRAACPGPSTILLTFDALEGLTLAPPDDFLTCALRYTPGADALLRCARHDPRLVWRVLEVADARPLAATPTTMRAAIEAGITDPELLRAAGPGHVVRVPVPATRILADGSRVELPGIWATVATFAGPMPGPY
jgi:hypothetical protein